MARVMRYDARSGAMAPDVIDASSVSNLENADTPPAGGSTFDGEDHMAVVVCVHFGPQSRVLRAA